MSHDKLRRALSRARSENNLSPAAEMPKTDPAPAPTADKPTEIKSNRPDEKSDKAPLSPVRGAKQTRSEKFSELSLEKFNIVYDCRLNPAADQVKILRTHMLRGLLATGGNAVLITSPRPGDGKTVNAISLAISLAQEIERTVLLIDSNLRNPATARYFGLSESKGLSDYLLGKASIAEILINPGIDKLTLLPGGRPLATSSEFLGATRMEKLVLEMKERYADRILIFDGPDVLSTADAMHFSKFVDGIVLVAEAEKTTRKDMTLAIERLGREHLLGTILNKARD